MSDITYSRRAEEILDLAAGLPPGSGAAGDTLVRRANVDATLAVARAVQQMFDLIKRDWPPTDKAAARSEWVTFDSQGVHEAISAGDIKGFVAGAERDTTVVTLQDGTVRVVPLSFGSVALAVGA
jgi:hypothetical protein